MVLRTEVTLSDLCFRKMALTTLERMSSMGRHELEVFTPVNNNLVIIATIPAGERFLVIERLAGEKASVIRCAW